MVNRIVSNNEASIFLFIQQHFDGIFVGIVVNCINAIDDNAVVMWYKKNDKD